MDFSFEEENNFQLPDPSGKLDFTDDEEIKKNDNQQLNQIEQSDEQQIDDEQMMDDNLTEEEEEIDESLEAEDDNDESIKLNQATSNSEIEYTKQIINQNLILNKNKKMFNKAGLQEPVTPAVIKRKQFKPWFNSPTDSCLSPCTQKLFKNKKPI